MRAREPLRPDWLACRERRILPDQRHSQLRALTSPPGCDRVHAQDLVFNFYKVYAILDEIFLAGEIEETSKETILGRLEKLEKLD